jgi:RNA polymerase sigma-70 factor (ECF subfamily)
LTSIPTEIGPELVERAQRGDREGLRELVEAAYPSVRRWALIRTGDPSEADDLTQDVLIQMIRKLDSFRGTAGFSTWLYTVTRNAAADRFRKSKRQADLVADPRSQEALTPSGEVSADTAIDRGSLTDMVHTFFSELPLRQREVFDLVELQGLTSPEAAQRLGIEPVSVRAHLLKARKALRGRILQARPELVEDVT